MKLSKLLLAIFMLTGTSGIVTASNQSNNSIVAYWTFDEMSGSILTDKSDNQNNGTISGAQWTVLDGKKSLQFDGTDDVVKVPDDPSQDITKMTLEAVIYLNNADKGGILAKWGKGGVVDSYILYVSGSHLCAKIIREGIAGHTTVQGSSTLPIGEWIHVAATFDGQALKVYVNYQLDGQINAPGKISQTNNNVHIGLEEINYSVSNYLNGSIGKARIIDGALEPFQFLASAETVACWTFDKTQGNTLKDISDNQNDGVISGARWAVKDGRSSLQFDGTDDVVKVADKPSQDITKMTLEAVIYLNNANKGGIMGKWGQGGPADSYILYVSGAHLCAKMIREGIVGQTTVQGSSTLPTGKWIHVAATFDGKDLKVYVNYQLDGQISAPGKISQTNNNILIGLEEISMGVKNYYNGYMSKARISDGALEPFQFLPLAETVAYWTFDEMSGTILNDKSGNQNNGTVSGAQWSVIDGKNSLKFDGTNDVVKVPDNPSQHISKMTLEAVMYLNSADKGGIIGKWGKGGLGDSYILYVSGSHLCAKIKRKGISGQTTVQGSSTLPTRKWIHVAATFDGNDLKVYVNYQLDGQINAPGIIPQTNNIVYMGLEDISSSESNHLNGYISQARICNDALHSFEFLTMLLTRVDHTADHLLPHDYRLGQNYPNPFNHSTFISYSIPRQDYVTLKIFDVLGKEMATLVDDYKDQGYHTLKYDAANLATGLYFYVIQAGSFKQTKKMLLVK
jgi:hypothetical protein